MHVLLFDIDGTLIDTRGSGMRALQLALGEFGHGPPPASIDTCGRTDRAIVDQLFAAYGVRNSKRNWQRFMDRYLENLTAMLPQSEGVVLPGVLPLLERLSDRADVAMGLLTGNTPEGARIKLRHFGLEHYFAFGGFGETHAARGGVAEAAVAAARQYLGRNRPWTSVWVIGDTPQDVACARQIRARSLAVASGRYGRADLAEQQPDLLLDDLSQAPRMWELWDPEADPMESPTRLEPQSTAIANTGSLQ